MSVILILIIASVAIALTFLAGFIWAVRTGQFEDTCIPGLRVLGDDTDSNNPTPSSEKKQDTTST
jgi:cbb3-type cytochrome oxidase maturation protein